MADRLSLLIVDDHEGVGETLGHLLSAWEFLNVFTATGFLSACAVLAAYPSIDLLICDAALTGEMTGIDVADIAVKTIPDISVVLIVNGEQADIRTTTEGYKYLHKPFDRRELAELVINEYMALKFRLQNTA